jgi:hypothetical protein
MRACLVVSGTIFALFAAMHFAIAYEHWRVPAAALWSGLGPALIGICGGALAIWAFRLTRSATGADGAVP